MKKIRAYRQDADGRVTPISISTDGSIYTVNGDPRDALTPTGETRALKGWADSSVAVYKTTPTSAVDVLVPIVRVAQVATLHSGPPIQVGDSIRIVGAGVYHQPAGWTDWNQVGTYCSVEPGTYLVSSLQSVGDETVIFAGQE